MGKPSFPVPETLEGLFAIFLRNNEFFSLVDKDGRVYGEAPYSDLTIPPTPRPFVEILTGDQLAFTADTIEEAKAFLYGCFLVLFGGASLKSILEESAPGSA